MFGRKSSHEAEVKRHGISCCTESEASMAETRSVGATGVSGGGISSRVGGPMTEATKDKMSSAKGGIDKTQKIYDLVSSRYKNGNAIFMEVSKAQNDLMLAKLAESLNKYDIWVKYADLKKVDRKSVV